MRPFQHIDATSPDDAIALLQTEPESAIIAGGTDLLVLMKARVLTPRLLVNVKTIDGLNRIAERDQGALAIGALVTMADLAQNKIVRANYPILADAMNVAASPQLRNVATVAGNLCQRPRCWYYRGSFECFLKGGSGCPALTGHSRDASIFGGDRCYAVNPSDLAPALVALDASLVIQSPAGRREVPLHDFFTDKRGPVGADVPVRQGRGGANADATDRKDLLRQNILGRDEMIVEVTVPLQPARSHGIYLKAMERQAWSFAQASVAIQLSRDNDRVVDVSIVLGSVAPVPRRAIAAEDALRGKVPTPELIDLASTAALTGAQALGNNSYKVDLVRALVRRGLITLTKQA